MKKIEELDDNIKVLINDKTHDLKAITHETMVKKINEVIRHINNPH